LKKEKVCCFAGHNERYSDELKNKIKRKIEELIKDHAVNEFMVDKSDFLIV